MKRKRSIFKFLFITKEKHTKTMLIALFSHITIQLFSYVIKNKSKRNFILQKNVTPLIFTFNPIVCRYTEMFFKKIKALFEFFFSILPRRSLLQSYILYRMICNKLLCTLLKKEQQINSFPFYCYSRIFMRDTTNFYVMKTLQDVKCHRIMNVMKFTYHDSDN